MLLGETPPLQFTYNKASIFGPLDPVFVLIFCTYQNGSFFQNPVYVSVLLIFVASVGLRWSSQNNLSARVSGVLQGPCFC